VETVLVHSRVTQISQKNRFVEHFTFRADYSL